MSIDYLVFRANALSSLAMANKRKPKLLMSKTEIEEWIKSEYMRHYGSEAERRLFNETGRV